MSTVNAKSAESSSAETMTYRDGLFKAMTRIMDRVPRSVTIGQGVDDFKGIFGTTTGFVEKYGAHRVIDTPLAEEGITGICIGMALQDAYPVMTHIRSDFGIVAMNQIVNLAAKYKYMFGGRFDVPMLLRMVIGRSWGQGAQHSQSLQSLFAHIPGLVVIMPSHPESILHSYQYLSESYRGPVISLEHRLMYDLQFNRSATDVYKGDPRNSFVVRPGKDLTVVATSIMVLEALRAADYLQQHSGLEVEVIDMHCISHPNFDTIFESVKKTGKLLVADTSWKPYGVCAEVTRAICERDPRVLRRAVETFGMQPAPCPTAKSLEDLYYPNLEQLTDCMARMALDKEDHGISLPRERSMADVYKRFRGPF